MSISGEPIIASAGEPAPASEFRRDVASLTTIRLFGVAAGFLTSVIAARLLGAAELGVAGVALTVGLFVALVANAGLSMSTIYLLRQRPGETRRVVDGLAGVAILSIVGAVIGGIAVATAVEAVGVPGLAGAMAFATGAVAGATVAVETSGALLLGLGASRSYTITEAIRVLAILVASAVLIVIVGSAAAYVVGAAAGMLVAAGYALVTASRIGRRPRPRVDRPLWREAVAYGLRGQVGNVLQYFTLRLDLILVAAIVGAAPAGVYLVATRVSEVVTQVANAAASLLFPAVARHGADSDPAFTAATVRAVTLLVAGAAIVLGIASWWLLPLVFGEAYASGLPALWLLLVAAVPLSVGRLLGGDIKGRGRPGLVSIAATIGLALLIVGDLAVLPTMGITGAAAVSVLAYTANTVALVIAYRALTGAALRHLVPGPADVAALARLGWRSARRDAGPNAASVSRTRGGGMPPSGRG